MNKTNGPTHRIHAERCALAGKHWRAWSDTLGADDSPYGYGATEAEARADLQRQLEDAEMPDLTPETIRTYSWNGIRHPISRPDWTDFLVAGRVRMLMRDDLDHEFVVCAARDRIVCLSEEKNALHILAARNLERAERAEAELNHHLKWAALGVALMRDWPELCDLDGFDLHDMAVGAGVLVPVSGGYDPEEHVDSLCVMPEPGDPWFEIIRTPARKETPDAE